MLKLIKIVIGGFCAIGSVFTLVNLVQTLLRMDGSPQTTSELGAAAAATAIYTLLAFWLLQSAFRKSPKGIAKEPKDKT